MTVAAVIRPRHELRVPSTKRARSSISNKAKRKRPDVDLDQLIEEATVDAHGESEQATGFYTMMEEHLAVPFTTSLLGVDVTVDSIDLNDADQIIARCSRGRAKQNIAILELPLPSPPPAGGEWIEAYRRWARRR